MSYTHTPSGWCSGILTNTRWKRASNTSGCGILLCDSRYWNGRGDRGSRWWPLTFCRGTYSRWCDGLKNTRGIVARIQGRASCSRDDSRCCSVTSNTKKGSSNPGGELVVPGMIPSGVASRPIPGRVVQTLGRELVVPGMIPGGVASRPFCL